MPPEARAGDSVSIVLRLVNDGSVPVDVPLQGRPVAFDVSVTRPDGSLVWRRLEGEVVTAILQLRSVPAGDTLVFQANWDQRDARRPAGATGRVSRHGIRAVGSAQGFEAGPVNLRIRP